jgi:transposase
MAKVRRWVGLDVHARWVLAAIIDGESGELCTRRLPGNTSEVVEFCCSLPTRVAYEAGPTGYGLARALHAAGVGCVVAAPGKIERPAADKVKTDQRDAERVLRLLEDEFECRLYNAAHLRHVPGRKSDVQDAEWGCQLIEHGLVRASFVPPRPLREPRDLVCSTR